MRSDFRSRRPRFGSWREEEQDWEGAYTAKASFVLNKPASHPVAYGLFIGGMDLSEDNQRYTYFVIRQDGKFLLKKRNGAQTSNVAGDWMDHPAIVKPARALERIVRAFVPRAFRRPVEAAVVDR